MQTTLNVLAIPVKGELFTEEVALTGITEYGISWQDLTTGKVTPPPEGTRFDIYFAGTLEGNRIKGEIEGVDFLTVRADGRFQLDLHATITTDDGATIAARETGLLIPPQDDSMIAQLQLSMDFVTHIDKYKWMNDLQCWAIGEVDWNTGKVSIQAYHA